MRGKALILPGLLVGSLGLAAALSWLASDGGAPPPEAPIEDAAEAESLAAPGSDEAGADAEARRRAAHRAMLDREYPLHGLITSPQLPVRVEPDPDAQPIGWLRLGGRVRMKPERVTTSTCATGWYELHPRGWACAGQGIEVGEEPPGDPAADWAADTDSPLPYRYLMTREPQVPEYHQPPSRADQRAAAAHGRRYAELLEQGQERRAELLRDGRLAGEPDKPAVVARYLHRGFYVASNGTETRMRRRFVRTVRGSFVKEAQLLETTPSDFAGVELDEETALPVAWAVRTSRPLYRVQRWDDVWLFREDEGYEAYERQDRLPWVRRENIDGDVYHVLEMPDGEERYLRAWFAAVAEPIEPPRGVADDEPWVHVDVGEQTLVLYRGATPVYATLVSSGLDGHDTPRGEFRIRRKFVSDTMANLGPDAGDDSYRIDDVPWTQYFEGSVALHGAFWHHRFGLQRSHGCVNLAPRDARFVFEHTWPSIPEGWHGVSTERGAGFEGSRVIVTD
ncbi:MAG TPA: L,D-transpeptidase [Sandaracinaceae bacterium LLY-WYZ-13_1]|nr:L,D-transpeptidase [Sandaracinaceae bacterium LLY-WYZ-13_1]